MAMVTGGDVDMIVNGVSKVAVWVTWHGGAAGGGVGWVGYLLGWVPLGWGKPL